MKATIAVVGGSGLYQLEGGELIDRIEVPTPFGLPSDLISIVRVGDQNLAFLPRHGAGRSPCHGCCDLRFSCAGSANSARADLW